MKIYIEKIRKMVLPIGNKQDLLPEYESIVIRW